MGSRVDRQTRQANGHALSAEATRNLPLISAAHHRALQLILATEANDMLLTAEQRRNARILQQHYHQQYVDTCLLHHHDRSSALSDSTSTLPDPSAAPSSSSSSSSSLSSSSENKSLLERVISNVDKALERKRTTRGFVSAIQPPTEDSISQYTICLKDLAELTCQPELDLLPPPEPLESLREIYNQHRAEAAAAAAVTEAGAGAQAADQVAQTAMETQGPGPRGPKDEDVIMADSSRSPGSPTRRPSPQSPLPIVHSGGKESKMVPRNGSDRATKAVLDEKSSSGTMRNRMNTRPPPSPPSSIPPSMQPKYAMYGDDEDEDDRNDHAVGFRPSNNYSNGMDRPMKRARADKTDGPGENGSKPMQFISAKEQLIIDEQIKEERRANHYLNRGGYHPPSSTNAYNSGSPGYGSTNTSTAMNGDSTSTLKSKTLGTKRTKFKSPINKNTDTADGQTKSTTVNKSDEAVDERLRNIDPRMVEAINNEIMESLPVVTWDDISGLEHAKKTIKETITWPMLRPDIFTGLRRPPKGLLLFGPPGTGKTMIGKCIASQSKATFFSISSASLTSKWIGDGEKMVRALFAVARCHQPAVIFMDEIDSLLTQRSDGEVEASRRIKTEFLVQFDGVGVGAEDDRILIIGATNRPQEIDEAARRRFQKRLYIPLPESQGRHGLMVRLLEKQLHDLTPDQIQDICDRTDGYSGSDMTGLCREAALGPVRAIQGDILDVQLDALRPINHGDFLEALLQVRASVSDRDLDMYRDWDKEYGSMAKG